MSSQLTFSGMFIKTKHDNKFLTQLILQHLPSKLKYVRNSYSKYCYKFIPQVSINIRSSHLLYFQTVQPFNMKGRKFRKIE